MHHETKGSPRVFDKATNNPPLERPLDCEVSRGPSLEGTGYCYAQLGLLQLAGVLLFAKYSAFESRCELIEDDRPILVYNTTTRKCPLQGGAKNSSCNVEADRVG